MFSVSLTSWRRQARKFIIWISISLFFLVLVADDLDEKRIIVSVF